MVDRRQLSALFLTALVVVPLGALLASAFSPEREIWAHLAATQLPELLGNTLWLCLGVTGVTGLLGVSLGWLTGACDFPGRRFFSWALALPLAIPAYVMAFIFLGLMDFAGPVQSALRELPGLERFMLEVRTTPFVVLVLSLTLYPYVYLLSRASFLNQGQAAMEAARTLGAGPWRAFWKVSLPMSRPWIASGLILVLMETLADFGAVAIFNYDTLTTAIYKSWYGFFSLAAAAQLSSILVLFALCLIISEGFFQARMRFHDSNRGGTAHSRLRLRGWQALGVTSYCILVFLLAFLLPAAQLILWSIEQIQVAGLWSYGPLAARSLFLGVLAALVTVLASLALAYAKRHSPTRLNLVLCKTATIGYALPGTVLAVAVFLPTVWVDNTFQDLSAALFSVESGPLLQGTIVVMLAAYLVRFMAAGVGAVDGAMVNIRPHLDEAAAIMGVKGVALLRRIHLPLLKKGLLTALILVLVDVIKELPITLMTRPFGWDTLAVKIYELTSEGEWERAAFPGLCLVLIGILPVIFIVYQTENSNE